MVFAFLVAVWLVAVPPPPAPSADVTGRNEYVPFCEVVRNPEKYDQRWVTTAGLILEGPEASDFYDPSCDGPDLDVFTLPVPLREGVQRSSRWIQMGKLLDKDHRAFVVVRAIFDAYHRYEGPLPADPRMQEIVKGGARRFGHQNVARFRLRIESVEFVAPVSK